MERLDVELGNYLRQQEQNERDWESGREAREYEAKEGLTDPDALSKVLNDEALVLPLTDIFRNLQRAIDGDQISRDAVLSACHRLERTCYHFLLGEDD